jgi:hypothetical protein
VTFILGVTTAESVWMLADRRVSWDDGRTQGDARKIVAVDTDDGVSLIGYSGLAVTGLGAQTGFEISKWMSNVLRGRNLPLG